MFSRIRHISLSRIRRPFMLLAAVSAFFAMFTDGRPASFTAASHVKVSLVALDGSIQPGKPVTVALKLEHEPHWHTYWINAGTGYPISIAWELPDGWLAGEIQWPVPTLIKDRQGTVTGNGYEGIVYLPITLTAPGNLAPGSRVVIKGKADWLMCADVCEPGNADVSLTLPVAPVASDAPVASSAPAGSAEFPLGGLDVASVASVAPTASALRASVLATPPMPETPAGGTRIAATRATDAKTVTLRISPNPADTGADANNSAAPPHFFSRDGFIQYDQPQPAQIVQTVQTMQTAQAAQTARADGKTLALVLTLPVSDSHDGDGKRLTGVLAFKDAKGAYRGYNIDVPLNDTGAAIAGSPAAAATTIISAASAAAVVAGGISASSTPANSASTNSTLAISPPASSGISIGILFLAFIGGLILNLMPCVFPVLGIKILGFVNQAGAERRKVTMHGIAFAAGVIVSFWALAGLLAVLRAGGDQLGWGFQLQSPVFVFVLAAVMLVFAMSMSGVFEFGLSATSLGGSLQAKSGCTGSFFTGVLATVVATPCSAPFLASALGAALVMSAGESFLMFTVIAIGLSAPYLLLSIFPGAVKMLPRPGAWMETFKQVMAFPLYATVGYLAWVLAGQLSENGLLMALLAFVLIALGAWFYGRYAAPGNSTRRRTTGIVCATACVLLGCWLGWPRAAAPTDIVWEKWSPAAVASARASGRTVYVDFTARWCATCQANKKFVFSSGEVLRTFHGKNIVALRADWTSRDAQITSELARFGRSAVPFNLIYKPGAPQPVVLPELLTPGIVLDALK
jgi:thiol:disulfide interchange protein DsbD